MILEVEHVSKRFGGVPAVDDCSFGVQEGQVVGVIGPNGAGKSTLLELLAGFQSSTSGSIRFKSRDTTRLPAHAVASLGIIRTFQLARVWGRLTVMENLLVAGSQPQREQLWRTFFTPGRLTAAEQRDRVRARQLLTTFDLLTLKDSPAERLSGGQRRLLEFARILMARAEMVLLDEPSASLSPVMTALVIQGIKQLASGGVTVLLIEHDMGLVEDLCDRILVMSAGKLIADGSMNEHRANKLVIDAYLGALNTPNRPGEERAAKS
jgi:ABC-type branched-subunit amino acid transport system ATPase component